MLLKQAFLCFVGLSAGGVIAAGVFAFLAMIGVYPRMIGTTHTSGHITLYETVIILGGIWGNLIDLYQIPVPFGGVPFLAVWGLCSGIFVGSLVMSLAETLKALPVFCRRVRLAVGIQYVILAIAAGKLVGALIYFVNGFGGT